VAAKEELFYNKDHAILAHERAKGMKNLGITSGIKYYGMYNEVEFPTKSGHEVKGYSDCSYSAGETYPSDE
jgi:hypothetical protein